MLSRFLRGGKPESDRGGRSAKSEKRAQLARHSINKPERVGASRESKGAKEFGTKAEEAKGCGAKARRRERAKELGARPEGAWRAIMGTGLEKKLGQKRNLRRGEGRVRQTLHNSAPRLLHALGSFRRHHWPENAKFQNNMASNSVTPSCEWEGAASQGEIGDDDQAF